VEPVPGLAGERGGGLARELERIGLSDGQDAIEDAEKVREEVLKAAEEAWPD
jgi:hypothetical protein